MRGFERGAKFQHLWGFCERKFTDKHSFYKKFVRQNPDNDIVAHLRMLEKHKAIYEISEDDMYRVPTVTTFGQSSGVSVSGVDSAKMQAWELMLTHKDEIITALREAGYTQAQITGVSWGVLSLCGLL